MERDIAEYDEMMSEPGFWDNTEKAQQTINDANGIKEKYKQFKDLETKKEDLEVMLEMLNEENDAALETELSDTAIQFEKEVEEFELQMLLSEPYDKNNALLEIHPGAGGTESQDWGSMLYRMYTRWSERKGFKIEILDYQDGDEAGIKSVTLLIKGQNAYGYLKAEKGVHRLVRISPFDSAGRRHTSFASIDVVPEINEDIDIDINPDDLRIDTYRASGAGGQHVNKTASAVRLTHLPTGIAVAMQDERSQIKNREKAMKVLRARVYDQLQGEAQSEYDAERKLAVGTGDRSERIRTYNFPQNRVTDHRIGLTIQKLDQILSGKLDEVVDALVLYDQTSKMEQLQNNEH